MEDLQASGESFKENVARWSKFCPEAAKNLDCLTCKQIKFATNSSNETILVKEEDKGPWYLHSNKNAQEEATLWFQSLNLQNTKVLYIFGIGLGYYYEAAKEWLHDNPHRYLIFLEDNLEIIYRLFETKRGSQILWDKQVRLQFFNSQENSDPTWSYLAENFCTLPFKITALEAYILQRSNHLQQIESSIAFQTYVISNIVNEQSSGGARFFLNFFQNLLELPDSFHANALFGKFAGIPAIICGAGPSLEKNFDVLKTLGDKAIVFAGGTAMNATTAADFTPHFGVGIDPNEAQLTRLMMNKAYTTPYFYRQRILHKALQSIHGPHLYVNGAGGYEIASWFEEKLNIAGEEVAEGFNVVNLSISLAYALGCNPIIFVGLDLAYSEGKSYPSSVIAHPTNMWRTDFRTKGVAEELLHHPDIDGKTTTTLWKWIAESIWIGKFAQEHISALFINATEGGIGMPGVVNIPLEEAAERLLHRTFDFNTLIHGEIQNAMMPKNVTPERIRELVSELERSLTRCSNYCEEIQHQYEKLASDAPNEIYSTEAQQSQKNHSTKPNLPVLADEEGLKLLNGLTEEEAYKCLLHDFDNHYPTIAALELLQIQYEEANHSPEALGAKKSLFQADRYAFLKRVADLNIVLTEFILKENPIEKHSEGIPPSEEKAAEDTVYLFEDDKFLLIDPSLGLCHKEKISSDIHPILTTYPSGALKTKQHHKNGTLHGPSSFWSEQGNLICRSWYIEGKRQGKAPCYYVDTQQLYCMQQFCDGELHGKQEYYFPNGQLSALLPYHFGKLNGNVEFYYQNSVLQRTIAFVEGKRQGREAYFSEDGTQLQEMVYENNKPVGITKTYFPNGQISQETIYDAHSILQKVRRWREDGSEVAQQEIHEEDYFDAVTKQTSQLTDSLENVLEQLMKVVPLITENPTDLQHTLKSDLESLRADMDNLKAIGADMLNESGLNFEMPKEAIWKTPTSEEIIQKQIEEMSKKMNDQINSMKDSIFAAQAFLDKNKENKI